MNFDVISQLSNAQLVNLRELKQRITDLHGSDEANDDSRLLRFLVARDYDADKATTMLSDHIIWRKKHGIDDLLQTYKAPEVLDKYYPGSDIGYTKDGDPVSYLAFGDTDFAGICKSVTKGEFSLHIIHQLEGYLKGMRERSEKEGKLYQTWVYILDFENSSLAQVTNKGNIDLILPFFRTYEANYPERLKNAYVINASLYFTLLYSFVKPLLFERTKQKVKIFGKDGWKEELAQIMDPEDLPAFLGGTKTDPGGNPRCPSFVKVGGPVPPSYWVKKTERSLCSKPGVKKYDVPRLSRTAVKIDITEPGSRIEWEFETKNYEIGFGLRYRNLRKQGKSAEEEELVPVQKMDTRIFSETGTYFCEKPGTYIVVFDNSFSWFRSKELYLLANVVKPDGQRICVTS